MDRIREEQEVPALTVEWGKSLCPLPQAENLRGWGERQGEIKDRQREKIGRETDSQFTETSKEKWRCRERDTKRKSSAH